MGNQTENRFAQQVHDFVTEGFTPPPADLHEGFRSDPTWAGLRETGTELWLDTGDLEEAARLWTRQFTGLTTNNTLLNREVQKGMYDELIGRADRMLRAAGALDDRARRLELAFILNARHGLRLVEAYDAFVSVEEHTDLAHDVEASVAWARRYHAICPERFLIKIPLTPAGLLAARRLGTESIPVNITLGFSARQNYVAARIGRPRFVNVFLGRLNAFVADNGLGDGTCVGERATLASQRAIRRLRETAGVLTRQTAASLRSGGQVRDLGGMDLMTLPPKAAAEFLQLALRPEQIVDCTDRDYQPPLAEGVDPTAVRLETLWDIPQSLVACLDALEAEDPDGFSPGDLVGFFAERGCGDVLISWTAEQIATSAAEGKIPSLENWRGALAEKAIGLDSLMNLAALNSFRADQRAMDERVARVLAGA